MLNPEKNIKIDDVDSGAETSEKINIDEIRKAYNDAVLIDKDGIGETKAKFLKENKPKRVGLSSGDIQGRRSGRVTELKITEQNDGDLYAIEADKAQPAGTEKYYYIFPRFGGYTLAIHNAIGKGVFEITGVEIPDFGSQGKVYNNKAGVVKPAVAKINEIGEFSIIEKGILRIGKEKE